MNSRKSTFLYIHSPGIRGYDFIRRANALHARVTQGLGFTGLRCEAKDSQNKTVWFFTLDRAVK